MFLLDNKEKNRHNRRTKHRIMIEIQIKEDKYEIPTEWKGHNTRNIGVVLYNIIKKYTETAQGEDEQEIEEPKLDEVKVLRMNRGNIQVCKLV